MPGRVRYDTDVSNRPATGIDVAIGRVPTPPVAPVDPGTSAPPPPPVSAAPPVSTGAPVGRVPLSTPAVGRLPSTTPPPAPAPTVPAPAPVTPPTTPPAGTPTVTPPTGNTPTDFGGGDPAQQAHQIADAAHTHAPPGFDATKWADTGHQTTKYVAGRILAAGGGIGDILRDPHFAGWKAGGGPDTIVDPSGNVYDVWFDYGGGAQRVQWTLVGGPAWDAEQHNGNQGNVGGVTGLGTPGHPMPTTPAPTTPTTPTTPAPGGGGGQGGADILALIQQILARGGGGSGTPGSPGQAPGPIVTEPGPVTPTTPRAGRPRPARRQYQSLLSRNF